MKTENKNTSGSEIMKTTNLNNYQQKTFKNINNSLAYSNSNNTIINYNINEHNLNNNNNCNSNNNNYNYTKNFNNDDNTNDNYSAKITNNQYKEYFNNNDVNHKPINNITNNSFYDHNNCNTNNNNICNNNSNNNNNNNNNNINSYNNRNNIHNDYLINHNKILNYQQQQQQTQTTQISNHLSNLNHNHNHLNDIDNDNQDQPNDEISNENELFYYKTKNLTKINRSSTVSILSAPVPLISGAGAAAAGVILPQNEISSVTTALETIDDTEAIKCIFLCEFHVTAGRKITVQVPENYLSKEKFETVSRYVIPHVELQRSFLCLSLLGFKILGYPVRIDNKQYARNAFYFNLCFVFAPTTRTIGYEPVVKKLSEYLLSMEKSSRLLSQQSYASVEIGRLARILTQVRNDINSKKVCMLQEGSTLIPMCVVPRYLETVIISPHHAAALTDDFYKYVKDQWDLTTLRILPHIDGFNHVNRITALADVALELVCDCLKHLVLLGVAVLVPVFQYSNVYRPTPKLSQLAKDRELQQRCVQRCSKTERKKAKIRDIFRFFASMAHGATFGELCVRFNPQALNISEKQMVLFGQLEGLIRRVEKYPVTVERDLYAEDVDNITKRKLGLVSGQIPNTPVFEQQQSQISNNSDYHNSDISNNSFHPINSMNDSPTSNRFLALEAGDDVYTINNARKYRRLPSKPIPRSGRAAASPPNNNIICNNPTCPKHCNRNSNKNEINVNKTEGKQQTLYNGLQSFDEICSATGLSCQQLDYHLARDKHVIVLLK
ncbi:protein PF3D7_1417600-like [Condylostylus longicornis]|uniref:protein PF3D7_1417600-like n=1 Tax=Condylostylus longicornis TaxID=2530218 RepID=UPI00244E36C0|nr:protein PF3D7_1417600-like [Condylostylus longicornis]XP_055386115.1 protein PF3D7_1417600-like [Condylostylus longicornis]